jgi:hypothetical protein
MNERIKELAERCWDTRLDGRHFDIEQFAELIVQECADLCSITASGRDAEDIEEAILKHFGVE